MRLTPYRILVVDDSAFMRKIFSDLIVRDANFIVVATASNGLEAIAAVREHKPDAITMDLEMPKMNGLDALQYIMKQAPTPIIMLSGISEENTRETIKALQYGAFDFIRKPMSAVSPDIHQVGELLLDKLRIAVHKRTVQPLRQSLLPSAAERYDTLPPSLLSEPERKTAELPVTKKAHKPLAAVPKSESKPKRESAADPVKEAATAYTSSKTIGEAASSAKQPNVSQGAARSSAPFKHIIAIGTSTGGPRALHEVITALPKTLSAPVLIVQHMPPKFTRSLAQRLDSFSELRVVEAQPNDRVEAGTVYIAPGGYHMILSKDQAGYYISLSNDSPRSGHRPSVDVMFESLMSYPELKLHTVIMTGMGSDGTKGLQKLKEHREVSAIAEAEESCIVYGMPRSAIEAGLASTVLPLSEIASFLTQSVTIE
ncbi:chemotaxis response regulator protein-glutamate methylesterase [Paenibacillus sp. GCM10023252]|uniref:protein-glutamate methylesterase/protein-glutamine glutaminase n=1 Tax=Paenibacillus sp. GCM10023252 TaxID=3252649 RepID=UPI003613810D